MPQSAASPKSRAGGSHWKDRAAGFRTAFGQGGSKARGAFSDTLDALTVILHARARAAATAGEETRARGAACAVDLVERAKALASGNVNPQLITAGLIRDLTPLLR